MAVSFVYFWMLRKRKKNGERRIIWESAIAARPESEDKERFWMRVN